MNAEAKQVMAGFAKYSSARRQFLTSIGLPGSNRDPLAEFAECLAASLLEGRRAPSRTQKGWDIQLADGSKVQVKYLANRSDAWVNEHPVRFENGVTRYALLIIEDLSPRALVVMSSSRLTDVCSKLGKRHPNQDCTLQFTRANFRQLIRERAQFEALGVEITDLNG